MPVRIQTLNPETAEPNVLPAESSAILRIFGRNTLWLWFDLGGLKVGTLLAGLFLIRYFGPSNFGIYSSALAVGWLTNAVIDLGLTRYAAREVAAVPGTAPPILAATLCTTVSAALLQLALLTATLLTGHFEVACIAAGLLLCNFEGTASLCSRVLTAELRSKDILPGSIFGAVGLMGMAAAVIVLHLSVLTMLLGLACKSFCVFCLRLWQLRSSWPKRQTWRRTEFQRVFGNAWPYFQYNLTQVGYGRIAIVCFGLVASPQKVGWFAAAFVIADVFPQWSYASSGALLPVWTKLFVEKRYQELLALRQRLLDVVVFSTIPLWIGLALFAPQICSLLGSRFLFSAPVLRIVSSRSLLAVLDGFLGHGFLIAINQVKERQRAQSRSLVLLAALTLVLGRYWGPIGVATAVLISDSSLILQYLRVTSRIAMKIEWPAVMPAAIAGVAMVLAALFTPASIVLPLRIVLAILAYLGSLLILSKRRLFSAGRTLRECAG
jgi:O-antigen/teichoic acid export membrane protein